MMGQFVSEVLGFRNAITDIEQFIGLYQSIWLISTYETYKSLIRAVCASVIRYWNVFRRKTFGENFV